jgi:RNA polymerase sigma-70 factor (ECF subfamily)
MKLYRTLGDPELIEMFNNSDKQAFAEIYERYWAVLYQHARRMLQDEEQAKDVVQDVFTMLLNKMGMMEFRSTLSAYLYSSVRNAIISRIRNKRVQGDYLDYLRNYTTEGIHYTDNVILEKELAKRIEAEIENLPPKMRRVFELSRKNYLNASEIAEHTGVSEGTVKKQLQLALKHLRGKLSAFFFLQLMTFLLWLNRMF